jgi:hypothetical protein
MFRREKINLLTNDTNYAKEMYAKEMEPRTSHSTRYLYYYNCNGWSNQVVGLAHAAQLANATNRTLILPPVLSHKSTNYQGNARESADEICKTDDHILKAKLDAKNCENHVKFSEIIDMSKLSSRINVSFIDLCDFVKEQPALVAQYFRSTEDDVKQKEKNQPKSIDLVGSCTIGRTRSYAEMVEYFQSIFAEKVVAIIPSAFILYNSDRELKRKVMGYVPAPNLLKLMLILRKSLPVKYIGVHLRYKDGHDFQCDSDSENKIEVLERIQNEHHLRRVYIASNSQKAVKCYKDFLSDHGYQAFHLDDLLEEQKNAIHLLPEIKVPRSEMSMVIDQNLVSMGKRIVLINRSGYEFGSTFQWMINIRHMDCMNQLMGGHE